MANQMRPFDCAAMRCVYGSKNVGVCVRHERENCEIFSVKFSAASPVDAQATASATAFHIIDVALGRASVK